MSDNFTKWFLPIWTTATAINAVVWLWSNFPLGLIIIAAAGLLILRAVIKERRRRMTQGYWLQYQGPAILRGDDDEFAVVYYESEGHFAFYGKHARGLSANIISVPNRLIWRLQSPGWMAERRELILARIQQDFEQRSQGRQIRIVITHVR